MKGHRGSPTRAVWFAALPVIVLTAAAGMVWKSSYASFSPGSAHVAEDASPLSDDDGGRSLFSDVTMAPGDSGTRCIELTTRSATPGEVRMFLTGADGAHNALADHLLISIELGVGGTFASCAAFVADPTGMIVPTQTLATAAATFHDYGTGAGHWATTGDATGESKSYRLSWTFDTTGMSQAAENALMGQSSGIGFQWEIQGD